MCWNLIMIVSSLNALGFLSFLGILSFLLRLLVGIYDRVIFKACKRSNISCQVQEMRNIFSFLQKLLKLLKAIRSYLKNMKIIKFDLYNLQLKQFLFIFIFLHRELFIQTTFLWSHVVSTQQFVFSREIVSSLCKSLSGHLRKHTIDK